MKNLNVIFLALLFLVSTACNTTNNTVEEIEDNVEILDGKIYNVLYEVDSRETMIDKYDKVVDRLFMKLPKNELLVGEIKSSITQGSMLYKDTYWAASSWHFDKLNNSTAIAEITKVENNTCYIKTRHNSALVKLKVITNYKLLKDGEYKITLTNDKSTNGKEKEILNTLNNKKLSYKFSKDVVNKNCTLENYNISDKGSYFLH